MTKSTKGPVITPGWLRDAYPGELDVFPSSLNEWDPVDCGDTLFLFLMRELSECADDLPECRRRVWGALDDLTCIALELTGLARQAITLDGQDEGSTEGDEDMTTSKPAVTPLWLLNAYPDSDLLGIDPDALPASLKEWDPVNCGDTLFLFLAREFADCDDDPEECFHRVLDAMVRLREVGSALLRLNDDDRKSKPKSKRRKQ